MTLDEIIACATPEERAFAKEHASPFAELHNDDGAMGVQARMTGLTEALQYCMMHEKRRARARGVSGGVLYNGLASVFATLLLNIVSNLETTDKDAAVLEFSAMATSRAINALHGDTFREHRNTLAAPEGLA